MKIKLTIFIYLVIFLFNITIINASSIKEVKIDNKTIFASNYKPEDFHGEWVKTGLKHYACSSYTSLEKIWENDGLYDFPELLFDEVDYNEADKKPIKLTSKTQSISLGKNNYTNIISHTSNAKILDSNTYLDNDYFNEDKEANCGEQDILIINYELQTSKYTDKFIIINKNKILMPLHYGYYYILEKKSSINKDEVFLASIYSYDDPAQYQDIQYAFNLKIRKYKPNENIKEGLE
ncbi:hypothetical protein ACFX5K_03205 [Rickettsiales bacterium LUAb2]